MRVLFQKPVNQLVRSNLHTSCVLYLVHDAAISGILMLLPQCRTSSSHLWPLQCTARKKANCSVFGSLASLYPIVKMTETCETRESPSKTSLYEILTKARILLFKQLLQIQINCGMRYLWSDLKLSFTHGTISNRCFRKAHRTEQKVKQEERFSLAYSFPSPCRAHLPQHFIYVHWSELL